MIGQKEFQKKILYSRLLMGNFLNIFKQSENFARKTLYIFKGKKTEDMLRENISLHCSILEIRRYFHKESEEVRRKTLHFVYS